MLNSYRTAGVAAAAAADVAEANPGRDPRGAAFFDVDNTLMKGASIFHFAAGLARRRFFSTAELMGFAAKQLKFVLSGSEDPEDMASATEAALSFVAGRSVRELVDLGQEVFSESLVDKLIPGTLALAQ